MNESLFQRKANKRVFTTFFSLMMCLVDWGGGVQGVVRLQDITDGHKGERSFMGMLGLMSFGVLVVLFV